MQPAAGAGSDFQNEVFHAIECPVCREIATPPVTFCKLGHFICKKCRKKLDRCVICKKKYTNQKCHVVEKIVSNVSVKCQYKPCDLTLTMDKLVEHLERCDYRPVMCNSKMRTVCISKPIELDKFVAHLQEVHGASSVTPVTLTNIKISGSLAKRIKEGKHKINLRRTSLFSHDGIIFILNLAIESALAFCWVSAVLPGSQASNYIADIFIGQKDMLVAGKIKRDTKHINWRVGVVPAHSAFEGMKSSDDCVAFPASRIISVVSGTNPGGNEPFTVYVELNLYKS